MLNTAPIEKESLAQRIIDAELTSLFNRACDIASTMIDYISSDFLNQPSHKVWDIGQLVKNYADYRGWGEEAAKRAIVQNPDLLFNLDVVSKCKKELTEIKEIEVGKMKEIQETKREEKRIHNTLPSNEEFITVVNDYFKDNGKMPTVSTRGKALNNVGWSLTLRNFSKERDLTPRMVLYKTYDNVPKPGVKKKTSPASLHLKQS